MVEVPFHVLFRRLAQHIGEMGPRHRNVVLESLLTEVGHQFAEPRDFADRDAAIHIEGIVGELALAEISLDLPLSVVGGDSEICHGAGGDVTFDGSETVFPTQALAQDIQLGYLYRVKFLYLVAQ